MALIRSIWRDYWRPLWILLALIFLFEAWLWNKLSRVTAWVVNHWAWVSFRGWCRTGLAQLPPYTSLAAFSIPIFMAAPVKLFAFWAMASGHFWSGLLVFLLAKVIGTALYAFIFDVTRERILEIGWFSALYAKVCGWLAWAHSMVDPIKESIKLYFGDGPAGRIFARAMALRARFRNGA